MSFSDESFDSIVARKREQLSKAADYKKGTWEDAISSKRNEIDPTRDYQGIQDKLNATGPTELSFAHNSMFAKDQDADSARGMNPQGEQTKIRALGIDTWEHGFYGRNRTLRKSQVNHYARLFGVDPSEVTADQIFAMGRRADNKFRNLLTEGQRGQFDPESETYSAIPGKQFEGFEESLWFPEGFRENASYGANVTYDPLSRKYKNDKRTKVNSFINPNTGVDLYKALNTPEFNTRWFDNTVEQNAIRSAYEAEHGTAYNTFKAPSAGDHEVMGYTQYGKPRIMLDGEVVSEKSITVEMDGKWINVPTIWNGEKKTEEWVKEKLINNEISPTSIHATEKEASTAAGYRSVSMQEIPLGEDKSAKKYKSKYAWSNEEKEILFGKDSYFEVFTKSISGSVDNLQATGYGLAAMLADFTGNRDFATAMLEDYQRNLAEAAANGANLPKVDADEMDWTNPDMAFRQLIGGIGEFLPSLLGGVGVGSLAAKGIKELVKHRAKSWAMSQTGKAIAANAAGTTAAAIATTSLYSGIGTGSVYGDIASAGHRDAKAMAVALGAGTLIGLLDSVLPKQISKQLGLTEKVKGIFGEALIRRGFINASGNVIKEVVKGAGAEGVTETLQEVIEDVATSLVKTGEMPEFTSDEAMSKWLNVFVKSALGGGGIKGITTAATETIAAVGGDSKVVRDAVTNTLSEAVEASKKTYDLPEKEIKQSEKNLESAVMSVEQLVTKDDTATAELIKQLGVSKTDLQSMIVDAAEFNNLDKAEFYIEFLSSKVESGGSDDGEDQITQSLRKVIDNFSSNESDLEFKTDTSTRMMDLDKEIQAINTKFDAKPDTAKNKAERQKQIVKRIQVTDNKVNKEVGGPAKKFRKAKRAETKVIREAIELRIKKIHRLSRKLNEDGLSKRQQKRLERERNNTGKYISDLSQHVNLSATTSGKLKRAITSFDYSHVSIKDALKEDDTIFNSSALKTINKTLDKVAKDDHKDVETIDKGIAVLTRVEDSLEAIQALIKDVTEKKDRERLSRAIIEHKAIITKFAATRKELNNLKADTEQNEVITINEKFKAKSGKGTINTIKLIALAKSDLRNKTSAEEIETNKEILKETYGDAAVQVYTNALKEATQQKTEQKLNTKKTQDVSKIKNKEERQDKLHSLNILYSLDPHTEEELNEIDVESLNAEELVVLNVQKKIAQLRNDYQAAIQSNAELVALSEEGDLEEDSEMVLVSKEIEGGEGNFFKGLTNYIEQAKNGELSVKRFTNFVDHIIRKEMLFSNALAQSTEDTVVNISKSPIQIVETIEGKSYPTANYWWVKEGATESLVAFIKTEADLAVATSELISKVSEYSTIKSKAEKKTKKISEYTKIELIALAKEYTGELSNKIKKTLKKNHILKKVTGYLNLVDTDYLTPDLLKPVDSGRVSIYSLNNSADLDTARIQELVEELGITDKVFINYLTEYFNEFKVGFNKLIENADEDKILRITKDKGAYFADKALNLLLVKDKDGKVHLPDEVLFAMAVSTIKWMSINAKGSKFKAARDIGLLLRNDPKYKPKRIEYRIFGNMGTVLSNAENDIGSEVLNALNLKSTVESTESTEIELLLTQLSDTYKKNSPLLKDPAILNALKGSVGLMSIKIAASIKTKNALKVQATDVDAGLLTIRHAAYDAKYFTGKSDSKYREINTVLIRDLEDDKNSDINSLLESFKHNTESIKRLNGAQSSLSDILSEPAEAPESVHQSFFLLPPKVREVVNKLNNVEWTHKEAVEYFKLLSPEMRATLTGIVNLEDVHISHKEAYETANEEKLRDMALVDDYIESGVTSFYYRWVAQKQHRLLIRSNTINGQRSKIHRALYKIFGNDSVISTKQQRLVFKIAVAQALGFKTDGNTLDATLDFFDNFAHEASADIVGYLLESKLNGTQDSDKFNKLLNEFLNKTKENIKGEKYSIAPSMHVLEAITALAQYSEKRKFTSDIMLETDAITNGYAISLMQRLGTNPARVAEYVDQLKDAEYDLTPNELQDYAEVYALSDSLARIGMFVNTQNEHPSGVLKPGGPTPTNYEEFLLSGAHDTYQTLGSRVASQIKDDPKELGKKATNAYKVLFGKKGVTINKEHVESLEVLIGIFTDSEDRLTKFARDFAKNPVLISGYGAGVKRVVEAIAQDGIFAIQSKLAEFQLEYNTLKKNRNKNAKAIKKLRAKVKVFERSLNIFFSDKFLGKGIKGEFDLKLNSKDGLKTLEFSTKQTAILENKLFAIYKHPVKTALDEILKPMAEMREVITKASEYQALSFIIQYKKEEKALVKPNVEKRLQIAEKLAPKLMPLYYGPWTSPDTPIQLIKIATSLNKNERIEIAFNNQKINRYYKKAGNRYSSRKNSGKKQGGTTTLATPGRGRTYAAPGPSAYTNMVQNMDFVNLASTLMEKNGERVLPIHDAEMLSVNDAIYNVTNFNTNFLNNSLDNSFLQITLDRLLDVKENLKEYEGLAEEVAKDYKFNSYRGNQIVLSLGKKKITKEAKKKLKKEQSELTLESIEDALNSEISAVARIRANLERIYGKEGEGKHSWIGQSSTMYLPESLDPKITIEAGQTESAEASIEIPKFLYHGFNAKNTDDYINADGDLVLKPSKNFGGKTTSVSFTIDKIVADDYSARIKGGGPLGFDFEFAKVFKINSSVLENLEIQNNEEVAINTNKEVVIPKGKFRVIPHSLSKRVQAQQEGFEIFKEQEWDEYGFGEMNESELNEAFLDYLAETDDTKLTDDISTEIDRLNNRSNIKNQPESTSGPVHFNKELAAKLQKILTELYPEIRLNFTNDPIEISREPNTFNQVEDTVWAKNREAVTFAVKQLKRFKKKQARFNQSTIDHVILGLQLEFEADLSRKPLPTHGSYFRGGHMQRLLDVYKYKTETPTLRAFASLDKMEKGGNKISLKEGKPISFKNEKQGEIRILNAVRDIIINDNPNLHVISPSDFKKEVQKYLEVNYLLGFAEEAIGGLNKYRIDSGDFTYHEAYDFDKDMWETDPKRDVSHQKFTIRYNNNYLAHHNKNKTMHGQLPANDHPQHFELAPVGFISLTHFPMSPKGSVDDAGLLHELQSDYIELLLKAIGKGTNSEKKIRTMLPKGVLDEIVRVKKYPKFFTQLDYFAAPEDFISNFNTELEHDIELNTNGKDDRIRVVVHKDKLLRSKALVTKLYTEGTITAITEKANKKFNVSYVEDEDGEVNPIAVFKEELAIDDEAPFFTSLRYRNDYIREELWNIGVKEGYDLGGFSLITGAHGIHSAKQEAVLIKKAMHKQIDMGIKQDLIQLDKLQKRDWVVRSLIKYRSLSDAPIIKIQENIAHGITLLSKQVTGSSLVKSINVKTSDVFDKNDPEYTYSVALIHKGIQEHIKQKGKDTPLYWAGSEVTRNTQFIGTTALGVNHDPTPIYLGKEEIAIRIQKLESNIKVEEKKVTEAEEALKFWTGRQLPSENEIQKLELEPTGSPATLLGVLDSLRRDRNADPPHIYTIEILLADLQEMLDDAIIRLDNDKSKLILATEGEEKLKPGIMYGIMKGIKGIKLEYVDSIPGIKEAPGGYKINLDNYDQKEITLFNQKDSVDRILGQADIDALTVLIDTKNQKQDTLPHEYAHHYIHMFRDSEIVKEGIKRFGTEEKLVQAIGEQVVTQEGEALNWWNKFVTWILSKLSDEEVLQILTDSFLLRKDIYREFGVAEATIKPNPDDVLQSIHKKVKQQLTPIMENESLEDNLKGIFNILGTAKGSPNFDGKGEAVFNTHLQRVFDELIVGATAKLGNTTVTLNDTDIRANGEFDPNIVDGKDAITVNKNQFQPLTYAEQGAQEVYLHEIIHKLTRNILATDPAFRNKVDKIRNRVREAIKRNAKNNGTNEYDVFLHKDAEGNVIFLTDKESEIEIAKEKYDYVFGLSVPTKHVLDEFLAYSLTNQFLFNELSTMPATDLRLWSNKDSDTVVEKIIKLIANIIEMISNKINQKEKSPNLALELYVLTKDIVNINESKRGKIKQLLYDTELGKKLDVGNEMVVAFFKELKDNSIDVGSKKYFELVDKWTENGKVNNFIANVLYSSKVLLLYASYGKFIDNHPKLDKYLSSRFRFFPSRFRDNLASIAVDFFGNTENSFSKLQYKSQKEVDVNRKGEKKLVKETLLKAFIAKTKLSKFEEVGLTKAVIWTDLSTLIKASKSKPALYSFSEVINLFADEKALDKEIAKYANKLKSKGSKRTTKHYSVQADQLATFMVKGKQNNHMQYKNAHAIHTLAHKKLTRKNIVKDLDVYITLLAIKKTEKTNKDTFIKVAEREFKASIDHNGITHMLHLLVAIKTEVLKDGFNNNPMLVTKGYFADIVPEDIQIEFHTIDKETVEKMRVKQFALVKVLGRIAGVKNEKIGLYISLNNPRAKREKGIGSLTSMQSAGHKLKDIFASMSEKGINEKIEDYTEKQLKQINIVDTRNATMMPIIDEWGNVSDFSIHMSHALKEDLLQQNLKFSDVMATTVSRHKDKIASKSIDKEAVQLLHEYKLENYEKHPSRFVNILSSAYVKEYFVPLPASMKYEIMQRATKGKQDAFYVERKYLDIVFGYVLPSISNLPLFNWHPRLQRYTRVAEKFWMENVALAKTNIILKVPAVPSLNFMSNFFTSWVAGVPPNYIIKKWKEGSLELKRYSEDLEKYELYKLKLLGNPSLVGPNTTKKKALLLERLNRNPVAKFIDMGLFNSITEDINEDDFTYRHKIGSKIANSRLGKSIQKKTKGTLFNIANQAYIGESTGTFKAIMHFTQMSDFIARYTMYKYKTEVKGMDEEKVWKEIVDTFVSYDQPLNRYIQWGNDIGALFFIKYAIRIQRATWHQLTNQPLNVGMLFATTQLGGIDIETIFESSFLLGNFDPNIAGFGKTIGEVLIPPGIEIGLGKGF